MSRYLASETDTLAFGGALARGLEPGLTVYLAGDLGSGKTTLARGVLRGLGYTGKVKSPTFTLVELYKVSRLYLYHFDFYRFEDPREFGATGFRDYFNRDSVCLVEWPEKAVPGLPAADVSVLLRVEGAGRQVAVFADTEGGRRCVAQLEH